jgi:hypothetical protein
LNNKFKGETMNTRTIQSIANCVGTNLESKATHPSAPPIFRLTTLLSAFWIGVATLLMVAPRDAFAGSAKVLYAFQGGSDAASPSGPLTFDKAGNIYGTAALGGAGNGAVFKLTRSHAKWTASLLYQFTGGADGAEANAGVIFDKAGNLYGTSPDGGDSNQFCYASVCGAAFSLTPTGAGWTETTLHTFTGGADAGSPGSPMAIDSKENIYSAANFGGDCYACGGGV